MGLEVWKHYFVAQIKSSLYPAGVLCFLCCRRCRHHHNHHRRCSFKIPSLNSDSPLTTSPPPRGPTWVPISEPGLGAHCCLAWGGWAFPVSRGTKCISLSVSVCLSVCAYACVSLALCVSALSVPTVAAFPSAHPESRSLAVLAPLQDVDVGAGEMALFECLVAGPADVEVDWLCRGRLLQPALLKCKMHFDGRKCKLLLTSVHEDDSGVYTCKLSTVKGNYFLRF